METQLLKHIIEAALMVAGQPLNLGQLAALFPAEEQPEKELLHAALGELSQDCENRGIELSEVASGYRFQVKQEIYPHITRMWEEKPQRYSRALLETMALIAYRQPITRGEIEEVRGVSVSTNIIRTLEERDWIRVVGHRDVPGKPALYGTTRGFLDYFNLRSLDALPTLAELRDIDELEPELALNIGIKEAAQAAETAPGTAPAPSPETPHIAASSKSDKADEVDQANIATDNVNQQQPTQNNEPTAPGELFPQAAVPEDIEDPELSADLATILAEVDQVLDSTAKTKHVNITSNSGQSPITQAFSEEVLDEDSNDDDVSQDTGISPEATAAAQLIEPSASGIAGSPPDATPGDHAPENILGDDTDPARPSGSAPSTPEGSRDDA